MRRERVRVMLLLLLLLLMPPSSPPLVVVVVPAAAQQTPAQAELPSTKLPSGALPQSYQSKARPSASARLAREAGAGT